MFRLSFIGSAGVSLSLLQLRLRKTLLLHVLNHDVYLRLFLPGSPLCLFMCLF